MNSYNRGWKKIYLVYGAIFFSLGLLSCWLDTGTGKKGLVAQFRSQEALNQNIWNKLAAFRQSLRVYSDLPFSEDRAITVSSEPSQGIRLKYLPELGALQAEYYLPARGTNFDSRKIIQALQKCGFQAMSLTKLIYDHKTVYRIQWLTSEAQLAGESQLLFETLELSRISLPTSI